MGFAVKTAQKKWENMRDYTKSLARKRKEFAPRSGAAGASPDDEPSYKYWRQMRFVVDVDKPVRQTVVSSITDVSVGHRNKNIRSALMY